LGEILMLSAWVSPKVPCPRWFWEEMALGLNWLQSEIGDDDLLDRVIVTTGTEAYRRADGVAVIPAALLGP
jgi:hypothetical protein